MSKRQLELYKKDDEMPRGSWTCEAPDVPRPREAALSPLHILYVLLRDMRST